eukprot:m.66146 g.66146  ORF g.66146 m.66146 type:complete len:164 (-) comp12103_c0_seq3:103-594(-)
MFTTSHRILKHSPIHHKLNLSASVTLFTTTNKFFTDRILQQHPFTLLNKQVSKQATINPVQLLCAHMSSWKLARCALRSFRLPSEGRLLFCKLSHDSLELTFKACAKASAPSRPILFRLKLNPVKVRLHLRQAASALAPATPILALSKLYIERKEMKQRNKQS